MSIRITAAAFSASLLLAACAGGQQRTNGESLVDAENAVARAELARSGDYDAADLRAANANLDAARAIAKDKTQKTQTRWLAAKAGADAELAIARAEWSKAHAQLEVAQHQAGNAKPPVATEVPTP